MSILENESLKNELQKLKDIHVEIKKIPNKSYVQDQIFKELCNIIKFGTKYIRIGQYEYMLKINWYNSSLQNQSYINILPDELFPYNTDLNGYLICKLCTNKIYKPPINETVLKNHYMQKHLTVWEMIRGSRKGRSKTNKEGNDLLIQMDKERIFSVAERLIEELVNSMI
ncbi:794_t:CDS:2 [Scutellospora calospora]|uniref:794_t:CDS:1 n=1 Tax=Scutellospora calospora TaxID=85575 RepID=A0ACA9JX69_9GLOM|nr:794_t:CDS:2 [Scutellospora calospora]